MALHRTLKRKDLEVVCLMTTITDRFHRVSMHGVREELVDLQARSLGYPLEKVWIPYPCPNETYEQQMREVLFRWKAKGVSHVIFGDLFLEDIRKYREEKLAQMDLTPVFPLWGENTAVLAKEMIRIGFRSVVTCVDPKKVDPRYVGRQFDQSLLSELPPEVDACGENGEFHTFVYDGPVFRQPIPIMIGESVLRDGFRFVDVMPSHT